MEEENREEELRQQKDNIARKRDALERQRGQSRGAALIGGASTLVSGVGSFFS